MNKPAQPLTPDEGVGPLDENGQEIWSPEFESSMEQVHRDPGYWAAIDEALASADRGEFHTDDEMRGLSAERRRRWLTERGLGGARDRRL